MWGEQIPLVFDDLRKRFGGTRDVGVSAIGLALIFVLLLANAVRDLIG